MVLPKAKQDSIRELYDQGVRISDICRELHADKKTVKKYIGLSPQTQPSQQIERTPAIPVYDRQPRQPRQLSFHDNGSNRYNDPEIERMFNFYTRDDGRHRDTRDYRRELDNGYQRPIRDDEYRYPIHPEPLHQPEPQTVYEQMLTDLQNRKGIHVDTTSSMDKWIAYQERRDEQLREDERRNRLDREHQERMKALNQTIIDANLQKKADMEYLRDKIDEMRKEKQQVQPEIKPEPEPPPPPPLKRYEDVKHKITGKIWDDYELELSVVPEDRDKVAKDTQKYMYNKREPLTREEQKEKDKEEEDEEEGWW